METPTEVGGQSFLESQTKEQLAPILKKMTGFDRAGEELQGLLPDWKFFQRTAYEKGTPADIAFFNIMLDTEDHSMFPSWVTQITDYSGCTNYGPGILTVLYGRWRKFHDDFPQAYRAEAENQVRAISNEFIDNNCACNDEQSVIQEFNLFLRTYPDDAMSRPLQHRLAGIQNRTVQFRFKCLPG